jgi:hypothetical protein
MKTSFSRREFLAAASLAAGAVAAPGVASVLKTPAARVAIGQCAEYNRHVTDTLAVMFDQLGGIAPLVRGKTVAIKLNMTGTAQMKLGNLSNQTTHWVHPQVIGSLVSLLGSGGARRIRLLEACPLEPSHSKSS